MTYTIETSVQDILINATSMESYTIEVVVNGDKNSSSYDITTDIPWIDIVKKNNITIITPNSYNLNNSDREGYIVFYNRSDSNIFQKVSVKQEYVNYEITIDGDNPIIFKPFEKNTADLYITVYGGKKNFTIKAIKKYDKDGNQKEYTNDIIIQGKSLIQETISYRKYLLQIVSYGICDTDNVSYSIIFGHDNDNSIIKDLRIQYDDILNYTINLPLVLNKVCNIVKKKYDNNLSNAILRKNARTIISEYIWFEYNNEKNPSIIEINDEDIVLKVYTQTNYNGKLKKNSDIYVKLYNGWLSYKNKINYSEEYTEIIISIGKYMNNSFDRFCKVDLINTDNPALIVSTKIVKKKR